MSTLNRPVAVLFDLDGTLIDSIALLLGSVHHAFEGYSGRVPSDREWVDGIGTPLASQLREFAASEEDVQALALRYRTFQREHHDRLTTLYHGALDVVRTLTAGGHPLGIVTSKSNAMMERSLAYTELGTHMRVTIGCDSCDRHKPDPLPVRLALEQLGYAPHEALFVGDSPHDMRAGRAAGVTTVAALWGPFSRSQLEPTAPDHYLETIGELLPLVRRIQGAVPV